MQQGGYDDDRSSAEGGTQGHLPLNPWLIATLLLGVLLALVAGVVLGLILLRDDPLPVSVALTEPAGGEKFTAPETEVPLATARPKGGAGGTATPSLAHTLAPTETEPPTPESTPLPDLTATTQALLDRLDYRRANGEAIVVPHIQTAPEIDGSLGDWPALSHRVAYDFTSETAPELSGHRSGPGDLDGWYALQWDEAYLYLGIQVTDDMHVQAQQGREMYKGDDIEIQLDVDLRGDFAHTELSQDDGQIGFSAGDFASLWPEAYVWRLNGEEAGGQGILVGARRVGSVTGLEARIPWQALGLYGPVLEHPFGFALCLSDNDTPGSSSQESVICTAPGRRWGDPTTWGTMVLVDGR